MPSWKTLVAWFTQSSTIMGLASIAGAAVGVGIGSVTWPVAIPIIVAGVVGMAMPQSSPQMQHSVTDQVVAAVQEGVAIAIANAPPAAAIKHLGPVT